MPIPTVGSARGRVAILVSFGLHAVAIVLATSLRMEATPVQGLDVSSASAREPVGASPVSHADQPPGGTTGGDDGTAEALSSNSRAVRPSESTRLLARLWRSMVGATLRDVVAASSANEDFESGTLAAWKEDGRGVGGWFVYANGTTPPSPTSTDSAFPFVVPGPPQGRFAAIADEQSTGRFILYRDVTLDGRYRLRLTVFYANAGKRFDAATSSRGLINHEQHYRIDLMSPEAPVDSVVDEHVLAGIFITKPKDPLRLDPNEVTHDLSPWEQQTVRLRFAVAASHAPLRAGIDDIRFERLP